MITVEFHCHTCYSRDSLVQVPSLRSACLKEGLQRLVVTDHDTIEGALQANSLDPHMFIIGEEILTAQGELLGIFVKELVPPSLPAVETIELLRSQGAFVSVAHPFDTMRKGHWASDDLLAILPLVDALEVFNSRCIAPQANQQALDFARQHQMPGIVGSDAHSLKEVGASTLTLPEFDDADSLKQALLQARAITHMSPPWVHFYSRYAAWRKKMRR